MSNLISKIYGLIALTLCLATTTVAQTATISVNGTQVEPQTVADIQTAIQTELMSVWSATTVTVTGAFTEANSTLELNIPGNKTLVWNAEYSGTTTVASTFLVIIGGEGSMEITEDGSVQNSSRGAVRITEDAVLTINGGTVRAGNSGSNAIRGVENATVIINSGLVENNSTIRTIEFDGNSALVINGGTVRNNSYSDRVVWPNFNTTVYITGGTLAAGSVYRPGTATGNAYYIGDNSALFRTSTNEFFTPETNLFRLDAAPALTKDNGSEPYTYDGDIPHDGTVTATFPTITGFTFGEITAVNGLASGYTISGNTVAFAGNFDEDNITLAVEGTLAGGRIDVDFTTSAFGVNIIVPQILVNGTEVSPLTVADIQSAIQSELSKAEVTEVTVAGNFSNTGNDALIIYIPDGKTVNWEAQYNITASLTVNGSVFTVRGVTNNNAGTFNLAASGHIENMGSGMAVFVRDDITMNINGGTVKSNSGTALRLTNDAGLEYHPTLTINSGTVAAGSSNAFDAGGSSVVIINDGLVENTSNVYTVSIANTSALAIHGGEIRNNAPGAAANRLISLTGASTILVAGGTMTANSIRRTETPTAYYLGSYSGLFRTGDTDGFTAGEDLFRLDAAPALTKDNGSDPYTYDGDIPHVGTVTATFPEGLALTSVTATPATATNNFATDGNTVTFAGDYDEDDITLAIEGTLAGGRIDVEFTTSAFGVNIVVPQILVNGAEVEPLTVANIRTAINTALETEDTVTVTGNFTGADGSLVLTIPENKTVKWEAEYSGGIGSAIIFAQGDGTLEIGAGGVVENTAGGFAITVVGSVTLTVDGGTVKSENSVAITASGFAAVNINNSASVVQATTRRAISAAENAIVTVNDGAVTNSASDAPTIYMDGASALVIKGGEVSNAADATRVVSVAENSSVYVTGGLIASGGIGHSGNAIGYYTGVGNLAMFNTTTTSGNYFRTSTTNPVLQPITLFDLEAAPTLTTESGTAYSYTATVPYEGSLTATFPTGLNIAKASSDEVFIAAVDGNEITLAGLHNGVATIKIEATLANGKLPVAFETEPFSINIDREFILVNGTEVTPLTVADIQTAIYDEAQRDPQTPVRVSGRYASADDVLTLSLPSDITVEWNAEYSGSVASRLIITYGGNMVITGGYIENTHASGDAIEVRNRATLTVSGGTVKSPDIAIIADYNATVIIDGGTVEATSSAAIYGVGVATVIINDGVLKSSNEIAIVLNEDAALAIHGGTLECVGGWDVGARGNSVIYVTGGAIAAGGIMNYDNATAYYIGASNEAKFRTPGDSWPFTEGEDLFRLDGIAPTLTTQSGTAYTYAATPHAGTVSATFPAGLAITGVTATPATATHNFSGNEVVFAGEYNHAAITLAIEGTLAGGRIDVDFTTSAFGVNVAKTPTDISIEISPEEITYGDTYTVSATTSAGNVGTFDFWYNGTTAGGNAYNSATKPTQAGTYTVTATLVSNTHIAEATSAEFTIAEDNTSILTTFTGQNINITLIGDKLRINGVGAKNLSPLNLRIYNLKGNAVMTHAITQNETISIAHLPKGVYMVNVGGKTVKFVK